MSELRKVKYIGDTFAEVFRKGVITYEPMIFHGWVKSMNYSREKGYIDYTKPIGEELVAVVELPNGRMFRLAWHDIQFID